VHRRAAENIAQTQRIDPIRRGRLLCNRMNRRLQRRCRKGSDIAGVTA